MQSQTHWIRKPTRQIIRAGHGLTLVGRPGVGLAGPASPARPINFLYDGPRPGQAHQISIWWAAARPGSSPEGDKEVSHAMSNALDTKTNQTNHQGLSWDDAGGPARGWAGPGRPAILI